MCPAKSCEAHRFEVVNPLAQAAAAEPGRAAPVARLGHKGAAQKALALDVLGRVKQSPDGAEVTAEVWLSCS